MSETIEELEELVSHAHGLGAVRMMRRLAKAREEGDDLLGAVELYARSAALAGELEDDHEIALCLLEHTRILTAQYDTEEALDIARRATSHAERCADTELIARALSFVGLNLMRSGSIEDAIDTFGIGLDLMQGLDDHDVYLRASLVNYTGMCFQNLNINERALECFLRALELLEDLRDERSLNLRSSLHNNIGGSYYRTGHSESAITHLERALDISEHLPSGRTNAITHNHNLGKILQRSGYIERAVARLERSHELAQEHGSDALKATASQALALARMESERFAEALELQEHVVVFWEHSGDPMRLVSALMTRGEILTHADPNSPGIEEDYVRALAITEELSSAHERRQLVERLVDLYEAQGRFEEACALHRELRELERAEHDAERTAQYQELKARHEVDQKEHEAELYRVRTQELEREVARRTRELEVRNQELSAARDSAEAASRAKSTFLAITSHELRTPLNAIIGYTEMLLEEVDTEDGDELIVADLGRVRDAAMHLFQLIEKILQLSNLEAGKQEVRVLPVHPGEVLEELVARHGAQAELRSNTLAVSFGALGDEPMQTDAQQLAEIAQHLLDNAIKFTKDGTITLRAHRDADHLVLIVEDDGIGMDDDTLLELFEPFEQNDLSFTRIYEGLGLGLTLCRHHVDLLGGQLTASSQLGVGSTFIVRLPWVYRE